MTTTPFVRVLVEFATVIAIGNSLVAAGFDKQRFNAGAGVQMRLDRQRIPISAHNAAQGSALP